MSQMSEAAKQRMEKACEKHGDEYQVRETEEFTGDAVFRFKDLDLSFNSGYQAGMQDPEANADIIAERDSVIRAQLKHIEKLETKNEHVTELINWVLHFEESDFKEYPSETHPYYRALYVGLGPKAANKALEEAKDDE